MSMPDGFSGKRWRSQEFTSSGTWTRPANVNVVWVELVGGGGGGGRAATAGGHGTGGGGGQVAWHLVPVTGDITVTIGAGGAAGASNGSNGSDGGNSTFGSLLTAYGGGGGQYGVSTNPVRGGHGGGGNYSVAFSSSTSDNLYTLFSSNMYSSGFGGATGSQGGTGGPVATNSDGSNLTYGNGGACPGFGVGGVSTSPNTGGGGSHGAGAAAGAAAAANSGGGGGGKDAAAAGAGGSGDCLVFWEE